MHTVVLNALKNHFHFNWKLVLLVGLMLPVFIKAGFWQIDRYTFKKQRKEQYLDAKNDLPIIVNRNSKIYQKVFVEGVISTQYWLVDNKIYQGQVGYDVVQIIETKRMGKIFVIVGWVQGSMNKKILPNIQPLTGKITIEGYLYPISQNPFINKTLVQTTDTVIPAIDKAVFKKIHQGTFFPFVLHSTSLLVPNAVLRIQVPEFEVEKHLGYAFQWFSFALISVFMLIWQSFNKRKYHAV